MPRYKGRSPCTKICCTNPSEMTQLYFSGLSSYEIGRMFGVSSTHIMDRLHHLGVQVRGRGSYSKPHKKRGGVIRRMSEEEIYLAPMSELGERMTK